jgi:hypothetical protein
MNAATVTCPPIQMHAATMCIQRTSVGSEMLSTEGYSRTRAPRRQRLALTVTHDAVEVERSYRVNG